MPESGRPTNAALLKITHGASGPRTNAFQKTRSDSGTAASALNGTLAATELRRVMSSQPLSATERIKAMTSAVSSVRERVTATRGSSGLVAQVAAALPLAADPTAGRSWKAIA